MSGPIVRSGPSPEFTKNWDSVFGKKSAKAPAKAVKSVATSAKAKMAKKPAAAKKKAKKKR
jgi:hypothetical protein